MFAMVGRTRRLRLLVVAVFASITIVLYLRNRDHVFGDRDALAYGKEQDFFGQPRVDNDVIRPKLEDIAPQARPPPSPAEQPGDWRDTVDQISGSEPVVVPIPPSPSTPPSNPPAIPEQDDVLPVMPSEPEIPLKPDQPLRAEIPLQPDSTSELDTPSEQGTPVTKTVAIYITADAGELDGFGQGRMEATSADFAEPSKAYWERQVEHFPITSTIQLPTGTPKALPKIQRQVNKLSMYGADATKLAAIKAVASTAWQGYKQQAWGEDEIKPVSGGFGNPFNGWGATLVDSLDTLWIMGMKSEFEEAVQYVQEIDFTTSARANIPVFETTIRYLGGLVAAYDVSNRQYRVLLDKAVELAEVLYSVFDTPNRMPVTFYRWQPSAAIQPHRAPRRVVLAELGSLSLEFTRLAQLTGEPKYYDAIARITDALEEWQNSTSVPGMWPINIDTSGCQNRPRPNSKSRKGKEPNLVELPDGTGVMQAGSPMQQDNPLKQDLPQSAEDSKQPVADRQTNAGDIPSMIRKRDLDALEEDVLITQTDPQQRYKPGPNPLFPPGSVEADLVVNGPAAAMQALYDELTPPRYQSQRCVPQGLRAPSTTASHTYSLGGASDSTYEYLLKEYILLGGQLEQYKDMYLNSAAAAIERLLYKPMTIDERDILLPGLLKLSPNWTQPETERTYTAKFTPNLEHLACFAGGMFALGGALFDKSEHVEIGAKLTEGCVWAYASTATGIMPDSVSLMQCEDTWGACPWNETAYWEALDPYEESRMRAPGEAVGEHDFVPRPSEKPKKAAHAAKVMDAPSDDVREQITEDMSELPGPLQKRQLVDSTLEPSPATSYPGFSADKPHADPPLAYPVADVPAPSYSAGPSSSARPFITPAKMYIPPPPLPHADYVKQKIVDDRLPPGFVHITGRRYLLRPEAIESVFYLYRITGDPHWRKVGWDMFVAVDRHTRAPYGASAIDDVTKAAPELMDQMESFWLAETLKYFWLLFEDPDVWSLDEWVLNTEAHLMRRAAFTFVDEGKSPKV